MPRTPLFASVVDALRFATATSRSNIPAEDVADLAIADRRYLHSLSRRQFVGAAAAGATGVALTACGAERSLGLPPISSKAARSLGQAPKVVVVGAGLAGLTCAYRLQQQGIDVTLYEATSRLGGRCWTNRSTFDGGQLAEHGGELIDQSHTTIRQLAQELKLPLDNVLAAEPNGSEPFFWFGGGRYPLANALRDLKSVWQPLKRDYQEAGYPTLYTSSTAAGRALDAMSVGTWIRSRVPGGLASPLGQLLSVAYTIEYGGDVDDQSALNLVYLLGVVGQGQLRLFGPSNEKYKVRGGNDRIVSGLASSLAGRIVNGKALAAIRQAGSGWTLDFDDRTSVTTERVVLAIPFSVMRDRVDTTAAGYALAKRRAIAELGMGMNAKLALQFTTRHWQSLGNGGDSYSDTGYQATWEVTRAQSGTRGILVDYTGAAVTAQQSGRLPAALAQEFLARAEPVYPGLSSRWNGKVSFDDWPRNPWTLGSYSFFRVGQYQRFAGAEREMAGSCHFAGECTSIDAQGYLEGAVESGTRAAREVLAATGFVPHA
ncbi:MAG: FAD-dependent oxidoreductase [Gemmatimonadaceae bacterium]